MTRESVDTFSQFEATIKALGDGGALLVSVDADGRPNVMTIGWGLLGTVWGRPILTVLVRPSRYTRGCIDHTGDFTVNVMPPERKPDVEYCGHHSGRDQDKLAKRRLTVSPGRRTQSPTIDAAVIAYECNVVQVTKVDPATFPRAITEYFYASEDYHNVYCGEILHVSAAV